VTGFQTYFEALGAAFRTAAGSRNGVVARDYRIAGQPIHIRFAGTSLLPVLTPALAHLQDEPQDGPPDASALHILAWDQSAADAALPAPPWSWNQYMSRGEIGGLDPERFRAWYHLASGILSVIDMQSGRAVLWVRDARDLPIYVVAAPFRMILNAWLARSGLHFAHAAAVGSAAGGLLLAGAGGSGKSTTSLACLEAGMDFISDDYCIVGSQPDARAFSIYCSAKSDEAMLQKLPGLAPSRQPRNDPAGEKALLLLHERFAERLAPSRRLLALLAPTVRDRPSSALQPIGALEAVRALAPTTMEQIAGPDASAWRTILSLARQLPCYRLELGRDVGSTPPLLSGLIEELSGGTA